MKQAPLRHPLANARGLGSAKEGVSHWWLQRVSAVAMIPLSTWLIYMLIVMLRAADTLQLQTWLSDPMVAYPLAILMGLMFYHGKLGMQVIIEDYFHEPRWKYSLLVLNTFLCFVGGIASIVAIFKLHFFLQAPIW